MRRYKRDKEYLLQVGMNFKLERTRQRLSQRKLAELSGVTGASITILENAKQAFNILTLKMIADALGKPLSQFV